jgi:hypothetical protein
VRRKRKGIRKEKGREEESEVKGEMEGKKRRRK